MTIQKGYELTASQIKALGDALEGDRESIGGRMDIDDRWKPLVTLKASHEDGFVVEVFIQRMPARFYLVESERLGIGLDFGTGTEQLVADIANAIAEGMMGIHKLPKGAVE